MRPRIHSPHSLCIPSLAQCPSESLPLRTKSVRATIQPGVSQSVGHLSQRIMCLQPYTLKSLSQGTTCICNFVAEASSHGFFLQRFLRGFRVIFPGGSGGFQRVPGGSESRSVNLRSLLNIAKLMPNVVSPKSGPGGSSAGAGYLYNTIKGLRHLAECTWRVGARGLRMLGVLEF